MNRMYAVLCAGMPGVWRLLSILAIQQIAGLPAAGIFASMLAIAQFVAFVSNLGFFNLMLARLPKLELSQRLNWASCQILMAAAVTLFIVTVLLGLNEMVPLIADPGLFLGLLFAQFLYQIGRHLMMAAHRYKEIFWSDIAGIGLTVVSYVVFSSILLSVQLWLSASGLILTSLYAGTAAKGRDSLRIQAGMLVADFGNSMALGLSMLFSGGVLQLMPWFAERIAGVELGAFIGGCLALLAPLLLFPRTLALYKLPLLAKAANAEFNEVGRIYRSTMRLNSYLVMGAYIGSCALVIVWAVITALPINTPQYLISFCLLGLSVVVTQLCMPMWILCNAMDRQNVLLYINASTFMLFVISVAIGFGVFDIGFVFCLVLLLITTILRFFLLQVFASKALPRYKEEIPLCQDSCRVIFPD